MKERLSQNKGQLLRTPFSATALYYALASGLWILLSDRLLAAIVTDAALLAWLQTLKGWAFILLTALLLHGIVSRYTVRLHRADHALEASEQAFQATWEQARVGLAHIALDGHYLRVNDRLCEMLGYTREELLALGFQNVTHPEDREYGIAQMGPLLMGDAETLSWEKRYLHKAGRAVRAHLTLSLARTPAGAPNYFVSVIEDIENVAESRNVAQALRDNQELLRQILVSVSDHIYVTQRSSTGEWTEVYGSPHAEEITGYSVEEFMGDWNFWPSLIHPDDLPLASAQLEQLEHGGSAEVRIIWLRDSARAMQDPADGLTIYGVISDVTARKHAEADMLAQDSLLQGVAAATHHLLTETNFDEAMEQALAALGEGAGVDRSYIFRCHPHPLSGEPAISQLYEWAQDSVEAHLDNPLLQNLEWRTIGFERWIEALRSGKPMSGLVRDFPSTARSIFEPQAILALMVAPITVDRQLWGFIGFDDCHTERRWTENELAILEAEAAAIGGAIRREQARVALQQSEARNRAMLQATPDIMFRMSRDGVYLDYMAHDRDSLYMVPPDTDMVGHHMRDFLPAEVVQEQLYAVQRALDTGEMQVTQFTIDQPTGAHHYEARVVVSGPDEVLTIVRDVTEQRQAEAIIQYQAYHDPLTGLPNRLLFHDRLSQALPQARRRGAQVAVLYMDLDRFKTINDTLGHSTGDLLLQAVAQRLVTCVRDGDTIARLGGDEFGLVLLDLEDAQASTKIAQKVLNALSPVFSIAGQDLFVTPSIGISLHPTDGTDAETLTKNAEIAMYRAKEQGRNAYQLYAPAMNATASRRLALENALRGALERGEFVLYYQPQVRGATGEIFGMEALVRWNHPELGFLAPGQWISLAEETGLIVPIGEWILRAACTQNRRWHAAGHKQLRVAVNLSARQFQQLELSQCITEIVLETGLPPRFLELEITENTIMRDLDRTARHLSELKGLGVHLAIDDFGTGHSSLNYLKRFDVDALKIDRSFVRDIHEDADDAAIVRAIVAMAQSLRLRVVAEGVETDAQRAFLQSLDCDEMQGYHFSEPLPAEQATALLANGPYALVRMGESLNGVATL